MIFYFSGTGNSLYAAKKISSSLDEELVSISKAIHNNRLSYELKPGETIGFVFPLYAWSAPQMVYDFIRAAELKNYDCNYIFAVATYGQNMGRFDKFFNEELAHRNVRLDAAFSLNMPNNYFYIWDAAAQKECLDRAENVIEKICRTVKARKPVIDIETGHMPEMMTAKINRQYNQQLEDTSGFSVSDACVGCGICSRVCNGHCIEIVDGKPKWNGRCTKCFACIHLCPQRAIEYEEHFLGHVNSTKDHGRYHNPNIRIDELFIRERVKDETV